MQGQLKAAIRPGDRFLAVGRLVVAARAAQDARSLERSGTPRDEDMVVVGRQREADLADTQGRGDRRRRARKARREASLRLGGGPTAGQDGEKGEGQHLWPRWLSGITVLLLAVAMVYLGALAAYRQYDLRVHGE
jgi:cytochrome c-type biogenesis protein CcmH/NrfG